MAEIFHVPNLCLCLFIQQHIGKRVYRRMTELTLNRVDYLDVGRYRCHVRNYYGDEWSQKANLTVVGKCIQLRL